MVFPLLGWLANSTYCSMKNVRAHTQRESLQLTSWPCTCLRSSPWDRTCEPPPERGLPQAPQWGKQTSPLFLLLLSSFTNVLARCLLSPSVSTKVNPGLKWSALLYGSSCHSLSTIVACVSRWGNAIYRMCLTPPPPVQYIPDNCRRRGRRRQCKFFWPV